MTLGGEGLLKQSRVPSYGRKGLAKSSCNFVVAEKKIQFTVPLAVLTVYRGERRLAENDRIPSYGRSALRV